MTKLVMLIFNRFFDNRLNRLSENQLFFWFSKIWFRSVDHIKIKKSILTPSKGNRLFHLTAYFVFCFFFNMTWNYDYNEKYINIFFTVIVISLMQKNKNGTGGGLLVIKIDFSIIDFFFLPPIIDYIDFCSFDFIKINRKI